MGFIKRHKKPRNKKPAMKYSFLLILSLSGVFSSCNVKDEMPSDPEIDNLNWYMGFMNSAPRPGDLELSLQVLDIWTSRADAAIINVEVPWQAIFDGQSISDIVDERFTGLAQFYRSRNLKLWVYIDPQNGLDRSSDAVELQNAGRSIAEPEIQNLYKEFVVVMDSILKPDHLGLALETNLIRDISTPEIYQGIRSAVNQVAQELKERETTAELSISIQADHAWGRLIGGPFRSIDTDFEDFPFITELGISSYPYFGFDNPEDIPMNYYSRLVQGKAMNVFISEGGWTSSSILTDGFNRISSPEKQQRYIEIHEKLLDEVNATAVFQLLFTDIDLSSLPDPVPEKLQFFAHIGLVDTELNPKPALDAWDTLFSKRRTGF